MVLISSSDMLLVPCITFLFDKVCPFDCSTNLHLFVSAHTKLPSYSAMEKLIQQTTVVRQFLSQELGKVWSLLWVCCVCSLVHGYCSWRVQVNSAYFPLFTSFGILNVYAEYLKWAFWQWFCQEAHTDIMLSVAVFVTMQLTFLVFCRMDINLSL